MQVVRLFIVIFLILGILLVSSPLVSGELNNFWDHARPGVIVVMDNLYAAIRDFVAGPDTHEGIQDSAPGVDFDRVITMDRGSPV